MDWGQMFFGCLLIAVSSRGFFRPHESIGSITGWRKRLGELDDGAPEAFFEEKRQLEAYPPSASATEKRLRVFSVIGIVSGFSLIVMAFL